MPGPYDVGDVVRSTVTIKVSGAVTDPTTLTFQLRNAADTITTTYTFDTDAEVVKETTEVYHFDNTTTEAGIIRWRWAATGTAAGAEEGSYIVRSTTGLA